MDVGNAKAGELSPRAASATSPSLLERLRARIPRRGSGWSDFTARWSTIGAVFRASSPRIRRISCKKSSGAVAGALQDSAAWASQGSFRAWLRAIARNKINDLFRRRHGQAEAKGGTTAQQQFLEVPQPEELSDPPEAEDALWRRAVELVRAEFEDRTWQAFWRVAVDGNPRPPWPTNCQ